MDRITFKGYGEDKPIDDNKTDRGRAINRRTSFLIKFLISHPISNKIFRSFSSVISLIGTVNDSAFRIYYFFYFSLKKIN